MQTNNEATFFSNIHPITKGEKSCVSLFSGILGLEIGLNKAGFGTKLAIDVDKDAKKTVCNNFPNLKYLVEDVSDVNATDILDYTGLAKGELTLLAGGLPCQPFSKSGLRKGIKDERGILFTHYIEMLTELEPQAFVIENVRGMISANSGKDFKKILQEFEKTGYTIYWKILDAANYGVPQFRQRLFIVGFKKRVEFSFPHISHSEKTYNKSKLLPFVTAEEALRNISNVTDFPKYKGKYAHLLKEIPEGLNYTYYTKKRGHQNPIFEWRSKFWYFLMKMDRKRPSLTIQAYPGNNTGPFHWNNRKLALCELKRLQTFPDWFEFQGSYMTNHRHIGNAVPPLLAYKIGVQIARALDKNKIISDDHYLKIRKSSNRSRPVPSGRRSGKGRIYVVNGKTLLVNRKKITYFVKNLLDWFNINKRKFPWRETKDPYKILITEHLLRKTTAYQVNNIYEDFFEIFPTFVELSNAPIEKIANVIRSLGLQNQRAKQLHEIALKLVEKGDFPRKDSELRELQGIGKYCSDAVKCQAWNKQVPMTDRNAVRVINRFFGIIPKNEKYSTEKSTKLIRDFTKSIIPINKAREFNLAIIDFAASICKSKNPLCTKCPNKLNCNWKLTKNVKKETKG